MSIDPALTRTDWLLDGRVSLTQPVEGYRAGMDAVVLAAAVRAQRGDRLLDVGCGAGAVMACAASRIPGLEICGLERDPAMATLAAGNLATNGLSELGRVEVGDAGERHDDWLNRFDHVVSNPPYFAPDAIQAVAPGRQAAYLADTPLETWLKFMLHTVRPKGRVTLIHRAAAMGDILAFMNGRFGEIEVLPVYSRSEEPAKRVVVTARKGLRRGDVILHHGLVLHDGLDRQLTTRAAGVMRGAPLEWS